MNNKISLSRIFICLLAFICTVAFLACNNALKEQSTGKAQNALQEQDAKKASKLYLIGGGVLSDSSQFYNDVYSSSDGAAWTKEETTNIFPVRAGHQVVVFQKKLWLIGGSTVGFLGIREGGNEFNDVWSSSDGKTWEREIARVAFSARVRHRVVVFKDKLYLVSGEGERKSDIWSSSDGKTWEEVTAAAAFSDRSSHQVVAFKNKLYLIGGYDNKPLSGPDNNKKNDVWSSSDGKTWERETAAAAFSARYEHQVVVFSAAQ